MKNRKPAIILLIITMLITNFSLCVFAEDADNSIAISLGESGVGQRFMFNTGTKTYDCEMPVTGTYKLTCSVKTNSDTGVFTFSAGEETLQHSLSNTNGEFVDMEVGSLELSAGAASIDVSLTETSRTKISYIDEITLECIEVSKDLIVRTNAESFHFNHQTETVEVETVGNAEYKLYAYMTNACYKRTFTFTSETTMTSTSMLAPYLEEPEMVYMGKLTLKDGMNNIKIAITNGDLEGENWLASNIEYLKLEYVRDVVIEEKYTVELDTQFSFGNRTGTFVLNVPEDGQYKLLFMVNSQCETEYFTITNVETFEKYVVRTYNTNGEYASLNIGLFNLKAGDNEISFARDVDDAVNENWVGTHVSTMVASKLGDELRFETVSTENDDIFVISEGIDCLVVSFIDSLDTDSVSNDCFLLSNGEDTIPLEVVDVKANNVVLSLLSKPQETDYTLYISNIKGLYGEELSEPLEQTLSYDSSALYDNGCGEISKIDSVYSDIVVYGVAYNSRGKGIEGRTVTASLYDASNTLVSDSIAVSETMEDGSFEITFAMPELCDAGKYYVKAEIEYSDFNEDKQYIEFIYIDVDTENNLKIDLSGTINESDVEAVLTEYADSLGISLEEDLSNISDTTAFFNHFIALSVDNAEDFREKYYEYLAMEILNQTSIQTDIDKVMNDKDMSKYFDTQLYAGIVENKEAFLNELMESDNRFENFDDIAGKWYLIEQGLNAPELKTADKSVYLGKGAEISLEFNSAQKNVTRVSFYLEADSENAFDEYYISDGINVSENGTKLEITAQIKDDTNYGKITLVSDSVQEYHLTLGGVIGYNVDGKEFDINLKEKDFTVRVTKPALSEGSVSTGRRPGTSNGGSSGNAGTSIIIPGTSSEQQPYFGDLQNVSWAEESIEELLKKGIVSKNDEKLFYPERNVTREEFVKMIVLAIGLYNENAECEFADVTGDAWYYTYVASAVDNNIINGISEELFGTGGELKRQDMALIAYRVLNLDETDYDLSQPFADHDDISLYAQKAVYKLRETGIINGVGENMFMPHGTVTRAMAAKVIYGIMKEVQ